MNRRSHGRSLAGLFIAERLFHFPHHSRLLLPHAQYEFHGPGVPGVAQGKADDCPAKDRGGVRVPAIEGKFSRVFSFPRCHTCPGGGISRWNGSMDHRPSTLADHVGSIQQTRVPWTFLAAGD
jgi:hypothetical protein